jgi:hypothetical protein
MGAYIAALLEELLPPMRLAARGCGYAIAVHGSEQRDIDLVAIPWTTCADEPELLVQRLVGVIAGVLGRAVPAKDWTAKPHGRRALSIITAGDSYVDLSIMPRLPAADSAED